MKIKIIGDRCQNCLKYTQYYVEEPDGSYFPINHGFCGQRQCVTHPGDRCQYYEEDYNFTVRDKLSGWQVRKFLEIADQLLLLVAHTGEEWKPEYEKERNLIRRHLSALRAQVERENERRKGA